MNRLPLTPCLLILFLCSLFLYSFPGHAGAKFDPILGQVREADSSVVTATGSDVTAGTSDVKVVTPKAMSDAGVNVPLAKATSSDVATGTDDAKYVTSLALRNANILANKISLYTYTEDATVDSAWSGGIATNAGATQDVTFTLPSVASLGEGKVFGFVNEVGVNNLDNSGTYYNYNGNIVHIYNSSGTFKPSSNCTISKIYIIGGGGGGGNDTVWGGGGGGAGGVVELTDYTVTANTEYAITIGDGGAPHTVGGNTIAFGSTAYGGGRGANTQENGGDGGSGGGSGNNAITTGGIGSQGSNGGAATTTNGGGGGYSQVGQSNAGDFAGGAGINLTSLVGNTIGDGGYFAGGGGGGGYTSNVGGIGGIGGGGNAAIKSTSNAENGMANTGGGGGGSAGNFNGGTAQTAGSGGSGIVILIYNIGNSSSITLTPDSGDTLPGCVAAGSSLKSSSKGNYIELRTTNTGWIATGVYPAAVNWVDQLD